MTVLAAGLLMLGANWSVLRPFQASAAWGTKVGHHLTTPLRIPYLLLPKPTLGGDRRFRPVDAGLCGVRGPG